MSESPAPLALLAAMALASCDTGWGPDAYNLTSREAPLGADGSISCQCWLRGCWSVTKAGYAGQSISVPDANGQCYVISLRAKWLKEHGQ